VSLIHKKAKVDQNLLENSLLPECRGLYPAAVILCSLQYSAPSHHAKTT